MKPRSSWDFGGFPASSTRQEKLAGRPASTLSSVSAKALRVGPALSSVTLFCLTPIRTSSSVETRPRRLGSVARSLDQRLAPGSVPPIVFSRASFGWNSRPCSLKNCTGARVGDGLKARRVLRERLGQRRRRRRGQFGRRRLDDDVDQFDSGGIRARTRPRAARQGRSFDSSASMSELMAKCVPA